LNYPIFFADVLSGLLWMMLLTLLNASAKGLLVLWSKR